MCIVKGTNFYVRRGCNTYLELTTNTNKWGFLTLCLTLESAIERLLLLANRRSFRFHRQQYPLRLSTCYLYANLSFLLQPSLPAWCYHATISQASLIPTEHVVVRLWKRGEFWICKTTYDEQNGARMETDWSFNKWVNQKCPTPIEPTTNGGWLVQMP